MSYSTFLHSDWTTKKQKIRKWWHRNDWAKAHMPSLLTRVKTEWYYFLHKDECIVVDGWLMKFYETEEVYMNWGDDINVYVIEKLTLKKVVPAKKLLFGFVHRKYCVIGSVLPKSMNRNTIVWGSGCMDFEQIVKWYNHPMCVSAVRGPLTRAFLLKHGIECPEIYGDPALLLPRVYQPIDKTKKYSITIIPHHKDWDNPDELEKQIKQHMPQVHVINLTEYNNWTDVIDEIVQSEIVYSSSLHGIIVSDAYGIPNIFAEFIHQHGKYDKYEDYFASVGRKRVKPISLGDANLMNVTEQINQYHQPSIDTAPLLQVCPFKLNMPL